MFDILLLLLAAVSAPFASPASGVTQAGEAPASNAIAQRERRRYQVSVRIGRPRTQPPLPRIIGPAHAGLPLPRGASLPLIVIDAGHGGHDPGAISPDRRHREAVLTLAIARAIAADLVASGRFRTALTRDDDRFLVLEERYDIARRLGADLFVSVHADAALDPEAHGASIYTLSDTASDREAQRIAARENSANRLGGVDLGRQDGAVRSILIDLAQRETIGLSAGFARELQAQASSVMRFRSPTHRSAGFVVLKAPDMPSVLFETGFISNPDDAARIASAAGQAAIARAVRDAAIRWFARQSVRDDATLPRPTDR